MASSEQRELMEQWYAHTGFEFLRKDEARASDPKGFVALWKHNVEWLQDVATEADHMIDEYSIRHL